jgi:hypothetical protein
VCFGDKELAWTESLGQAPQEKDQYPLPTIKREEALLRVRAPS